MTLPNRSRSNELELILDHAGHELKSLLQQRAEIAKRIVITKRTILGLSKLFGESVLPAELARLVDGSPQKRCQGLTSQCRRILMESGLAYSAVELYQQLTAREPTLLMRHKDPLASVTTILNRLKSYGEVAVSSKAGGQRVWAWITSEAPATPGQTSETTRTQLEPSG